MLRSILTATIAFIFLLIALVAAAIGALSAAVNSSNGPSPDALNDIPANYLPSTSTARHYALGWTGQYSPRLAKSRPIMAVSTPPASTVEKTSPVRELSLGPWRHEAREVSGRHAASQ